MLRPRRAEGAATTWAFAATSDPEMDASAEILVVDDEEGVREMVVEYLARHGYSLRGAADGAAMAARLAEKPADLVILDVNMPGEDGLTLARRLHERSDVCIVMLTAAGETVDRVVGLEIGADDYIAKPFDLRELLARVRTVLRRRARAELARPQTPANTVRFGHWLLDLEGRRLIGEAGELKLTAMEFDLLEAFARHPNKVLSRDRLLDLAHRRDMEPFDRSIDIRVTRIRKKIERDPAKPQIIKTIRGGGYMFVTDGGA
jgi:two-component system, OmpR family, phosphate regulon response regulator OmpR